jgi:hypothetical protein
MRDYARKVVALTSTRCREDLENDEVFSLAITRLVELIGEAASKYPKELQEGYPQIPWPKIIGTRNRLIQGTTLLIMIFCGMLLPLIYRNCLMSWKKSSSLNAKIYI